MNQNYFYKEALRRAFNDDIYNTGITKIVDGRDAAKLFWAPDLVAILYNSLDVKIKNYFLEMAQGVLNDWLEKQGFDPNQPTMPEEELLLEDIEEDEPRFTTLYADGIPVAESKEGC